MTVTPFELAFGVGLDLVLGDPQWVPHPVRGIGRIAGQFERALRRTRLPLRTAGVIFCVAVAIFTGGVVALTLPWLNVYWIYSFLAIRSLDVESMRVVDAIATGDLESGRHALSMIVGRDTAALGESDISRAVVETMSENFSDAVVAPLFWLVIAGPVGMAVFKAVSTLDSMVGYKNDRYRDFGWASARTDDLLNLVPARISAALVWLGAAMLGMKMRRSVSVTLRDGPKQPSPNSGYPEAAFAGALGVQLGGSNLYNGVRSDKPLIGAGLEAASLKVMPACRRLYYLSSLLAVLLAGGVLAWK